MSQHAVQQFVSEAIESYELVREFGVQKIGKRTVGDPELQKQVLDFIPHAAANGLLFLASHTGKVVGMSIVGPTNKPNGLHCYHDGGKLLFCFYSLVHPRWRVLRKSLDCLSVMLRDAVMRYPDCEVLCYFRHEGSAYKEMPLAPGGKRSWVDRVASRSGTGATAP